MKRLDLLIQSVTKSSDYISTADCAYDNKKEKIFQI